MTMIRTPQSTFGISVTQITQLLLIMISIIVEFSLSIGAFPIQALLLVQVKTTEPSSPTSKQVNRCLNSQLNPKTKTSNGVTTCQEKSVLWITTVPLLFSHLHQRVFTLTQIANSPLQTFQLLQTRHICQSGSNLELEHLSDSETNLFLSTRSLKGLSLFITVALIKISLKECKSLTTSLRASLLLKYVIKRVRIPKMITI
jgi:hypothetical protein